MYVAPAEDGGTPLDVIRFFLWDGQVGSALVEARINVWCSAGYFLNVEGGNPVFSNNGTIIGTEGGRRVCRACAPGTFVPVISERTSCSLCPSGYVNEGASSDCSPCDVGTFAAEAGASACTVCPPGTIGPDIALSVCQECPVGSFASEPGGIKCTSCGRLSYAAQNASAQCTSCPKGAVSVLPNSDTVDNCICEAGYYQKERRLGGECTPCPTGGHCHGRTVQPVTLTHYWSSPEIWPAPDTPQYLPCDYRAVRDVCIGYPDVRLVCWKTWRYAGIVPWRACVRKWSSLPWRM